MFHGRAARFMGDLLFDPLTLARCSPAGRPSQLPSHLVTQVDACWLCLNRIRTCLILILVRGVMDVSLSCSLPYLLHLIPICVIVSGQPFSSVSLQHLLVRMAMRDTQPPVHCAWRNISWCHILWNIFIVSKTLLRICTQCPECLIGKPCPNQMTRDVWQAGVPEGSQQ